MDLKKLWRERTDPTGTRLFFQLLHAARIFPVSAWHDSIRHTYLCGMQRAFEDNREDFDIADNMRDYWKCQNSGAA